MEFMDREITYELTLPLVRRVAARYVWRKAGWALMVVSLCGLFGVILCWHSPERPLAWVLVILAVSYWYRWTQYWLRIPRQFSDPKDRKGSLRVDEEGLHLTSIHGESNVKWSGIKQIWRFPQALLLFWNKDVSIFSIIPTEPLGEELVEFIKDKVCESQSGTRH